MTCRFEWSARDTAPARNAVLRDQGLRDPARASPRIVALANDALERYATLAEPRGLVRLITRDDFAAVYAGEGRNLPHTPLPSIVAGADGLALYACTVGGALTSAIADLFSANDPAAAYMLDAVASLAADGLAYAAAQAWLAHAEAGWPSGAGASVLPYSPGYCGWHVSGQRALFAALGPEIVGITLNDSCLMTPLKSVSGVLVAGARAVHEFSPEYECCDACPTRACEDRMAAVRAGAAPGSGRVCGA